MRWGTLLVLVTACWHSSPGPEPARWQQKSTPIAELLPDGAWLVVEVDLDLETSRSEGQRAHERAALADPKSIETADSGCSIPASHATFAAYGREDFAFAGRGVFRVDAMIACLVRMTEQKGETATHSTIAGHDVLATRRSGSRPYFYLASETGLLLMANQDVMTRALASTLQPVTADRTLGPLIARARARGGQIWAAARFPRDVPIVDEVLATLGVKLAGHATALTAAIHFWDPYQIEVDIELEQEAAATLLAAALVQKQHELVAIDKNLETVLGSVAVRTDHTHVLLTGSPEKVDWLQTLQALLGAVERLRGAD